jgi:hypothetical protein
MTTPPRTAADLLDAELMIRLIEVARSGLTIRQRVNQMREILEAALRAAPSPGAGETLTSRCPTCARALHKVMRPSGSMLNDDQFDAVRAGDWYCDTCPSNERGNTGYRYFWTRELAQPPAVSASPASPSDEETPCPVRSDKQHCNCWYDGEPCCACGDPAVTRPSPSQEPKP